MMARPSRPDHPRITVHSLVSGYGGDDAVANHRAYADHLGYQHLAHDVPTHGRTGRTWLLAKYSKILSLLRDADEREILVFVEDCIAFSRPLTLPDILGEAPFWLCQDGHRRDRANGGLIILRGGDLAGALIEDILGRCQALDINDNAVTRWNYSELVGFHSHEHDAPVEGCYPNLLFPSFGHALPEVAAFAVVFNPQVLPHTQDHRSNLVVIRHLTGCLRERREPFTFAALAPPDNSGQWPLEGRYSRVGLVLVVLPGQEGIALLAEANWRLYALHHGYALSVVRALAPDGAHPLATLLRCAGEQMFSHQFVLCGTTDVLIHDLKRPVPSLFGPSSLLLARAPVGSGCDGGLVGLRKDDVGMALMAAAKLDVSGLGTREDGGAADDGGFAAVLQSEIAQGRARLVDLMTWASHSAWADPGSFLVRYQYLPGNVRDLVMRQDADIIPEQLVEPPKPPPIRTSLSFLRHSKFNKVVMAITGIVSLGIIVVQILSH